MLLEGKTAIVTGASRGIGKGIAQTFAEKGACLVLVATNAELLAQVKDEINRDGGQAEFIAGDIADPDFSDHIREFTIKKFRGIQIVVNCAGIITRALNQDLSNEDWQRVLDVNLSGVFYLCRATIPEMRHQNYGKIINITSQMAKLPHPGASPSYEVSKAGLVALTRHLALHNAPFGICVNAIAPGTIATGLQRDMAPDALARILGAIPMQRLGEISEVAQAALFLASDMSSYITGEMLDVNGGSLMD